MRLRNLVGGIALSLFSLLAAPQAFAQSDPCAGPFTGPDVTISKSGSCNISSPINVTGSVSITVTGGSLTDSATINAGSTVTLNVTGGGITDTAAITGGSTVSITQSGGTVNVSDITSTGGGQGINISGDSIVGTKLTAGQQVKVVANVGSVKFTGDIVDNLLGFTGNMLISAKTSLATGNITTSAPTNYVGWVDLKAYQGGGTPTPFIIGGSGNANGVNGTITEATTSTIIGTGLYVTNGVSGSVGDIKVARGASIALSDPNLYTGYLILNANNGTITLPSDAPLTMSGSGSGAAGQIYLMASTVSAPSGSTVSANQPTSAQGFQHGVWIAANTVSFGGSTGLNLSTSGNQSNVSTFPTGAITITDDENVYQSFGWSISINSNTVGTLTFNGSGSPFAATANGDNSFITMDAYPIVFNAKSVSLSALGTTNHQITLGVGGATQTHDRGVTFNVTGATTIDASVVSGSAGTGGQVIFWDDQVTINGTTFTVKANGPTSGNGNGGTLSMLWGSTVLNAATKASFAANAATAGTGNGGSITYWPGSNISFGSAANQFSISAKGGVTGCSTSSTCNGGSVSIAGQDMAFASTQATAMNVAAGPTGDGGTINVQGGNITFTTGSTYALVANAGTTQGNGGTVTLNAFAALKVGTGAGAVNIAAKGSGTGNGGTINVTGLPLTLAGANVSVAAGTGTGSNGNGGNVSITTNFGGTITGNIVANGVGTGKGGNITISGDTPTITGATFTANGGVSGDGGTISLTTTGTGNPITISGSTKFAAAGGATTGSGGSLSFTTASNLTIDAASASVVSSGTGNGGSVNITTGPSNTLAITGTWSLTAGNSGNGFGGTLDIHDTGAITTPATTSFDASARGSGLGGFITISNSAAMDLSNATLTADGGCVSGDGGTIAVITAGNLSLFEIDADGGGGSGGTCMAVAVAKNAALQPQTTGTSKGGSILITVTTPAQWDTAKLTGLHADGQGAAGNGGKITVSLQTAVDLSDLADNEQTITAKGGDSGEGGTVTITNQAGSASTANVVSIITVDGGPNNTSTNDGTIILNGVTCNQLKVPHPNGPFPTIYWNCVTNSTGNDQAPANFANKLPGSIQTLLSTVVGGEAETQMFVFDSGGSYNTFFHPVPALQGDPNQLGGLTFQKGDDRIYTSSFERVNGTGLDLENLTEAAAHELGHSVDYAKDQSIQSHDPNYAIYLKNDLRFLDYVGGLQGKVNLRAPCSTNNTAPFDGVKSYLDGSNICDPTNHTLTNSAYAGYTNSKILSITQASIFGRPSFIQDQEENYAQVFAYLTYVSNPTLNTTGEYLLTTVDSLLHKTVSGQTYNYLACTQYWASNVIGGSLTLQTYCSTSAPWYQAFQNLPTQ